MGEFVDGFSEKELEQARIEAYNRMTPEQRQLALEGLERMNASTPGYKGIEKTIELVKRLMAN